MPAGVNIVWMKAHQSDRDAAEGSVQHSDLLGNRMADTPTTVLVRMCPFEEWKHCASLRPFWLLVGPKWRIRPENWPRVGLPVPKLVLVEGFRSWRPISLLLLLRLGRIDVLSSMRPMLFVWIVTDTLVCT
eukprot:1271890-Amphidinium_carterae.1